MGERMGERLSDRDTPLLPHMAATVQHLSCPASCSR